MGGTVRTRLEALLFSLCLPNLTCSEVSLSILATLTLSGGVQKDIYLERAQGRLRPPLLYRRIGVIVTVGLVHMCSTFCLCYYIFSLCTKKNRVNQVTLVS